MGLWGRILKTLFKSIFLFDKKLNFVTGNLTLLKEKLDSITEHVSNIHAFPENSHHHKCCHLPLDPDECREKAWLVPDSLVKPGSSFIEIWLHFYQAVTKIRTALHGYQNSRWNDLDMMTDFSHTGEIGWLLLLFFNIINNTNFLLRKLQLIDEQVLS